MQLAQVKSVEDLRQLLLIEKLFGGVPASVLKFSSGCRSADVFQSALNLDKLIMDAFGGQLLKDGGDECCGVSNETLPRDIYDPKKEAFEIKEAAIRSQEEELAAPVKREGKGGGGTMVGKLVRRTVKARERQPAKLKQIQEMGVNESGLVGPVSSPQGMLIMTRSQAATKTYQEMVQNHRDMVGPSELVKRDEGREETVKQQSSVERGRKLVRLADGLQINQKDYIKRVQEDPELQKCRDFANKGVEGYFFKHQLLYQKYVEKGCDPVWGKKTQLVVPAEYQKQIFLWAHEGLLGGHQGRRRTLHRVAEQFFFPKMRAKIFSWVQECEVCQLVGHNTDQTRAELGKVPIVEGVFDYQELNLMGPFPNSGGGNKFLLVATNHTSRFVHVAPLRNITALSVAKALLKYFSFVGFPKMVVSDQGSQFLSGLVTKLWSWRASKFGSLRRIIVFLMVWWSALTRPFYP